MELSDILSLVKAGYTREEISQMETANVSITDTGTVQLSMDIPAPEKQPEPAPVNAPVAEPEPVPAAQPQPQPQPVQAQPTMQDIMQSIAKLTSAIQANAIAQSVIPAGLANPPKAEDMLAEIIRPTFKERN